MMRTGLFYQWARGRAIVRNRCMREARMWQATIRRSPEHRETAEHFMRMAVGRARQAHRDWRRYRNAHARFAGARD